MVTYLDDNYLEDIIELRIREQYEYNNINKNEQYEKKTREYFTKHVGKDLLNFGIIENEKIVSIASFIKLEYAPVVNGDGKEIYIFNVYTIPEYRRKGYARCTLSYGIDYLKKLNYNCFRLHTNNEIAKKIYLGLGFHMSSTSMSLFVDR